MRRLLIWAPFAVFVALVVLVAWRLATPADSTIASRLVGQTMPPFGLPAGVPGKPGLAAADLATGKPHLLNIFASWCVPCAVEAPQLDALKKAGAPIMAIAIRDRPEDIARFLVQNGDPFLAIGSDATSSVQIALGSSGVPETFVVDGKGVIRHQHIGEIRPEHVAMLLGKLEQAR